MFANLMLHNVHQPVESPPEFVDLYPASDYNVTNYARRVCVFLSALYRAMGINIDFVCLIATMPGRHSGGQVHKVKQNAAPLLLYLLLAKIQRDALWRRVCG